ncbi:hypothetical protein ACQ4PT_015568 [Festuca glaucescens]
MSMVEAPSRSFMVMDDMLINYDDNHDRRRLKWEVVECKKDAVSCVPVDKYILEDIVLCVIRGEDDDPNLYPDMSIRLSDHVFLQVGLMIDDDSADIWGRDTSISCSVCAVEGDIMVIRLEFTARHVTGSFRAYYLVYNSANSSLSMIPLQDPQFLPIDTSCPLPLRREDGGYSLVLLANRVNHATNRYDCPALCLWSLLAPSGISAEKHMDQWVVKDRDGVFADCLDAHVAFSCNGNAVWGDLTQGIMYCSHIDLLKGGDHVNFKYIRLPKNHRIPHHEAIMMGRMHAFRTMGLVGNSIWFVGITPSDSSKGETMVDVLTLDITHLMSNDDQRVWSMHKNFRMQSIWELDAFSEKRLPKSLSRFPILRQEDAGILYMLLPDLTGTKGHLVGIDVGRSTSKMPQIVSSRHLAVPWMRRPVVLPCDFFKPRDMVD